MKIVYDNIIFSLQKAGGISIYWTELIKRFKNKGEILFYEKKNNNIFRKLIFYDVKNEKEITKKYKIKMIPTQVFLDENGNEIHRHVGFYPEEKIDEFLKEQGLQILPTKQHE